MKKSELKRHIIEALTPQEADKVDSKYKEIYGGMLKGNKKKLMKYIDPESGRPNPDKVAYGKTIKFIQKESKLNKESFLDERLTSMVREVYSEKQRRWACAQDDPKFDEMCKDTAISKKKLKEEKTLSEIDAIMEEDKIPVDKLEKKVKSILKKEGGAVGLKPLVDAAKELGATKKDLMGILKKMKDVKTHKDGDIIDTGGLNETGMDKAKKNMDMYKDKNRLQELIKSALMGPMNEKKQRPDYPDIDGDGDTKEPMVKAAKDKEKAEANEAELPGGVLTKLNQEVKDIPTMAKAMLSLYNQIKNKEQLDFSSNASMKIVLAKLQDLASKVKTNESFDSLVKKVDKAKGYTKKEAEKVAGAIAAKKMKGAGKGPTAKQKKRMAETILKELRGNINEAAGEDLELKSFSKKLYSYAKKEGAQAFLVDFTKMSPKTLGGKVPDNNKPSVFIQISKGQVAAKMVGNGVDQLYKDMVNSYPKFEFGEYKYSDKQAFPPYEGVIPIVTFTVKPKTTGKKGGVMATESFLNELD